MSLCEITIIGYLDNLLLLLIIGYLDNLLLLLIIGYLDNYWLQGILIIIEYRVFGMIAFVKNPLLL